MQEAARAHAPDSAEASAGTPVAPGAPQAATFAEELPAATPAEEPPAATPAEEPRVETSPPSAAAPAPAPFGRATAATLRASWSAVRSIGRGARASLPVVQSVWQRVPPRTVPVAAALLMLAGALALVPVSRVSGRIASLAQSTIARTTRAVRGALTADERSVPTEPQATSTADAPQQPDTSSAVAAPGTLAVFSRVPLELYISNRRVGTTEDSQILLPAGRYRVGLVSTRLKYRGEVTLVVRPGAVTAHTVSLPDGRVQVNTEPGAEVWVEGARAGEAPLGPLPVPIGTREIVVRHPDLGERKEYVEIRYGEVAEVNITRR